MLKRLLELCRRMLGRISIRARRSQRAADQTAAQARFWKEFRGGQREAEERSAKLPP